MISLEYHKGLPLEYESFLIHKYDSFITTCRYIEVYYQGYDIHYMLVYEDNKLIDLFVYGNRRNTAKCFNSLVSIEQNIVEEFIRYVFEMHSNVKKIEIVASYNVYNLTKSILYFQSDNHVLQLPQTIDEYFNVLSSSTRQTIKNRKNRLLRDYEKVNFCTRFGVEIDLDIVEKIIQLNTERLKQKGRLHKVDHEAKNKIYKFSQHYGCVAYIEVDGEIVAGSINTILNNGVFGHITGFDPKFHKYNVGEICAFNLIQTSIEKGLTTFNFLWGQSDLKKRLQGKPHVLYFYFVFRAHSAEYLFNKIKVGFWVVSRNLKRSKLLTSVKVMIQNFAKKKYETVRFL